ncbi:MAG: hypothetical protein BJ554DRAFT_4332, partial [Olpidium bornovanus]
AEASAVSKSSEAAAPAASKSETVRHDADIDEIFSKKPKRPAAPADPGSAGPGPAAAKKGRKSKPPRPLIDDDGFADSRGSRNGRRLTEDGLPIYEDKELLAVGGGGIVFYLLSRRRGAGLCDADSTGFAFRDSVVSF